MPGGVFGVSHNVAFAAAVVLFGPVIPNLVRPLCSVFYLWNTPECVGYWWERGAGRPVKLNLPFSGKLSYISRATCQCCQL